MSKFLKRLWGFPQNLIGFVLYKITKAMGRYSYIYKDAKVVVYNLESGVSLGDYIFIPVWANLIDENYVKHEYGHTLQSRKLGFLYSLIILIPSMIWNSCFIQYREKHGVDYYSFWTERWADKLGGVKRT